MEKTLEPTKNKGGRPKGHSPKPTETKALPSLIDDGEYVLFRVHNKLLAKLLLKDLI